MNIIIDYLVGNVPQIITTVVGIGVVWLILSKALNVLKEVSDLLNAIVVAFADKKLTSDEVDAIVKEAKDIPVAVKNLLSKS